MPAISNEDRVIMRKFILEALRASSPNLSEDERLMLVDLVMKARDDVHESIERNGDLFGDSARRTSFALILAQVIMYDMGLQYIAASSYIIGTVIAHRPDLSIDDEAAIRDNGKRLTLGGLDEPIKMLTRDIDDLFNTSVTHARGLAQGSCR